jgi:hypothetical protein
MQRQALMKNIKIDFTNECITQASGSPVTGSILEKSGFAKCCSCMDIIKKRLQYQIKNGGVFLPYIGLLTMKKPFYRCVHVFGDGQKFCKHVLDIIRSPPSKETLCQYINGISFFLRLRIVLGNIEMLKSNGIVPDKFSNSYILVDIDIILLTIQRHTNRDPPELIKDAMVMLLSWYISGAKAASSTMDFTK